jgi:hypothetical protein
MKCAPRNLTTLRSGTPRSSAFACLSFASFKRREYELVASRTAGFVALQVPKNVGIAKMTSAGTGILVYAFLLVRIGAKQLRAGKAAFFRRPA